jgi:hypothetical protein
LASKIPSFFFLFFKALGPRQGCKVQHLLVTWGRLKRFFFVFQPWKCLMESPWGWFFNFCTNRNAWFELNLGLDSLCKVGLGPNVKVDGSTQVRFIYNWAIACFYGGHSYPPMPPFRANKQMVPSQNFLKTLILELQIGQQHRVFLCDKGDESFIHVYFTRCQKTQGPPPQSCVW